MKKYLASVLTFLLLAASVLSASHLDDQVDLGAFWNKKPKQSPKLATGEIVMYHHIEKELSPFLDDECRLITTDALFGCLPEAKVQEMVKNLLFTFDNTYIDEARDCDDLAWEFIIKFRRFHRDVTRDVPLAPSAGFIGVKIISDIPEMGYNLHGNVGYHAIVIIRCQGGKWLLVDPGTKKVSEFTQHLYEGSLELRFAIF
jgi:hypothetical protein